MPRFSFLFFIMLFLLSCNEEAKKQPPVPTSSHNPGELNTALDAALKNYYALTDAFVNWDSTAVPSRAAALYAGLQAVPLQQIAQTERETAGGSIQQAMREIKEMQAANSLQDKRYKLNALTQNLFDFLRAVQYDEEKMYLQQCPMAFNDTEPGIWLSKTDSILNPYLGLHHPRYGKGMLSCGENKSVIDFSSKRIETNFSSQRVETKGDNKVSDDEKKQTK